jgi:hypothetical protein
MSASRSLSDLNSRCLYISWQKSVISTSVIGVQVDLATVSNMDGTRDKEKGGRASSGASVCYRRNVFRMAARLCRVRHQDNIRPHSTRANIIVRPNARGLRLCNC